MVHTLQALDVATLLVCLNLFGKKAVFSFLLVLAPRCRRRILTILRSLRSFSGGSYYMMPIEYTPTTTTTPRQKLHQLQVGVHLALAFASIMLCIRLYQNTYILLQRSSFGRTSVDDNPVAPPSLFLPCLNILSLVFLQGRHVRPVLETGFRPGSWTSTAMPSSRVLLCGARKVQHDTPPRRPPRYLETTLEP